MAQQRSSILTTDLRLVLVTPQRETWILDAIVEDADDPDFAPAGSPISLEIERPETTWLDRLMGTMLREWAADDRRVTIGLGAGPRARVQIESHGCRFRSHLVHLA